MWSKTLLTASIGVVLSGCVGLSVNQPMPEPEIPVRWQQASVENTAEAVTLWGWKDVVKSDELKSLMELALENNRDLRMALLNVERVREGYQISRSARLPQVSGSLSAERGRIGDGPVTENASLVGMVSYEVDLFGRIKSLDEASWNRYVEETHHYDAAVLALETQVVTSYLDLMASIERHALAESTQKSRQASYSLSLTRHKLGSISSLDLAQEKGLVDAAARSVALYQGDITKSLNALTLLVGQDISKMPLKGDWAQALGNYTDALKDLPSEVLLLRPDIRSAEARLASTTAEVRAARAALFPSLRLTGQAGRMSAELSDLTSSGSSLWSLGPTLHLPIFEGGRLRAQAKVATLDQQIALLNYEQSIREGFREVADILTDAESLQLQYEALISELSAAKEVVDLSTAQYQAGKSDYLVVLDAERTLYAAQQQAISLELAMRKLHIMAYKALGGSSA